jgi:hypothetical protein
MKKQDKCFMIVVEKFKSLGITLDLSIFSVIDWTKKHSKIVLKIDNIGFVNLSFNILNLENKFKSGFLINSSDLRRLGLNSRSILPFNSEIEEQTKKMFFLASLSNSILYLENYYVYFPLDGGENKYLLVYQVLNPFGQKKYIVTSNIEELKNTPVKFTNSNYFPDIYNFVFVGLNFKESIEDVFFNVYKNVQKQYNEEVNKNDFLVSMMKNI